jgi:SNF2 family DNA or RNA helicase
VYQQVLEASRKEVLESVGAQGLARSRMVVLTALLRLRQICCDLRLLNVGSASGQPPGSVSENALAVVGADVRRLDPPPQTGGSATDQSLLTSAPTNPRTPAPPSGKLELFSELLEEILDGDHRALVFSQFTSMLALLREQLEAADVAFCYLDGSTANRGDVVARFQQGRTPVFLISLKAGGVGLNLTAADTVIHFDPWWNPAVEDQASDRAHRIGQRRVVTSYKLITRGTVEEKILQLQTRKREVIQATLGSEERLAEALTWEEIQGLLAG